MVTVAISSGGSGHSPLIGQTMLDVAAVLAPVVGSSPGAGAPLATLARYANLSTPTKFVCGVYLKLPSAFSVSSPFCTPVISVAINGRPPIGEGIWPFTPPLASPAAPSGNGGGTVVSLASTPGLSIDSEPFFSTP